MLFSNIFPLQVLSDAERVSYAMEPLASPEISVALRPGESGPTSSAPTANRASNEPTYVVSLSPKVSEHVFQSTTSAVDSAANDDSGDYATVEGSEHTYEVFRESASVRKRKKGGKKEMILCSLLFNTKTLMYALTSCIGPSESRWQAEKVK